MRILFVLAASAAYADGNTSDFEQEVAAYRSLDMNAWRGRFHSDHWHNGVFLYYWHDGSMAFMTMSEHESYGSVTVQRSRDIGTDPGQIAYLKNDLIGKFRRGQLYRGTYE